MTIVPLGDVIGYAGTAASGEVGPVGYLTYLGS